MIKNKFNFAVFSMAFFTLMIFLVCVPATEASNKFVSGLCLGFLLSQAVFLLWTQESRFPETISSKENNENYLGEYWWNEGKRPNPNKNDEN